MDNLHSSAPTGALINTAEPLYGQAADRVRDQLREHRAVDTALTIAKDILAEYGGVGYDDIFALAQAHGAIRESLRILVRAVHAERGEGR
jgi:hypothetical protein